MAEESPSNLVHFHDQLENAERDTKELAKMLLELGISPKLTDEEIPMCGDLLENVLDEKRGGKKSVKFSAGTKPPSILKKDPLPPVKIHNVNLTAQNTQYQELVTRLCKTESVIQSLQLSLCSLQSSKDIADHEKQEIIKKLKTEIQDKANEFKKAVQVIKKSEIAQKSAEDRWKNAEKEVRNLQEKIQKLTNLSSSTKEASFKELDDIRDKSAKKIADVKKSLQQEQELRASLEKSHDALLTRVKNMEEAVERERKEVAKLNEESEKLKQENSKFKLQANEYTTKAASLQSTLTQLKCELDDKERAIQKLIQEQVYNNNEQTCLHNDRSKLESEIKNYAMLLDAQKASCDKLEREKNEMKTKNDNLASEIERVSNELDDCKKDFEIKLSEKEQQIQNELLCNEKQAKQLMKSEHRKRGELEERIAVLEECVQQQEIIIQEKQAEILENDKHFAMNNDQLKRDVKSEAKEKEHAIRVKENLDLELKKMKNSFQLEKQMLVDQIQELGLEISAEVEARRIMEEENGRLLERVSSIEHQEGMYKRMQENLNAVNQSKSKMAYDKGKLQSKVDKLEQELQAMASAQSNVIQLQNTNNTLEQKYSKLSTEFAHAKVELQRHQVQVNQMKIGMQRKEEEFTMAIASRDEAVREKNDLERQLDVLKEQENSKITNMKQSVFDCRNDNARLANDLESITTRHNELQDTIDSLQQALGQRDNEVSMLLRDKENYDIMINSLRNENCDLKSQLNEFESKEKERVSPLFAALEQARQDNLKLASSVDELLNANSTLEVNIRELQSEINLKTKQLESYEKREESLVVEAETLTQVHSSRMDDVRKKMTEEKQMLRKQLQEKYSVTKKNLDEVQSRCSDLARGNAELRGKVAEQDKLVAKLKQQNKSLKQSGDVLARQRELNSARSDKIDQVSSEIKKLEAAKKVCMNKNKEQAETILTFNSEINSLRDDIIALSKAQSEAKKVNKDLAERLDNERKISKALEHRLLESTKKYEALKHEKFAIEEKLKTAKAESVLVQKNLMEAQGWFKDKFSVISTELSENKRSHVNGSGDHHRASNKENISM